MAYQSGISPATAGVAGVAVGAAGSAGLMAFRSVSRRANVALGVGGLALAGQVLNQGALQTQASNQTATAGAINALTFTTGAGVTGEQVAAMRALIVQGFSNDAQIANSAQGIGNLLSTAPAQVTGNTAIAGVTAAAPAAVNNNSGILLLAVLGLVGYALLAD